MVRYARQNFMTPRYFIETLFKNKTHILGGSQAIGCSCFSFFPQKRIRFLHFHTLLK